MLSLLLLMCCVLTTHSNPLPPASICPANICRCDTTSIICDGFYLSDSLALLTPQIRHLHLHNCALFGGEMNMRLFANLSVNLISLKLINCGIETLKYDKENHQILGNLRRLNLTSNRLFNWTSTLEVLQALTPRLTELDLADNYLQSVDFDNIKLTQLHRLQLSRNHIKSLAILPQSLRVLDLSENDIKSLNMTVWPSRLQQLILDRNRIQTIQNEKRLYSLSYLSINRNPLTRFDLELSQMSRLQQLRLSYTQLMYLWLNIHSRAPLAIDLSHNSLLSSIQGALSSNVKFLDLSHCNLFSLPVYFFRQAKANKIKLDANPWLCEYCAMRWSLNTPKIIHLQSLNCSVEEVNKDCSIGSSLAKNRHIFRAEYSRNAILNCAQYGNAPLTWRFLDENITIGWCDPIRGTIDRSPSTTNDYEILPTGNLLLKSVSRRQVGRYECQIGENTTVIVRFRLDFSAWYRLSVFNSVFVGSLACGILTGFAYFIFNLIWLLCRKLILWRINQAERKTRFRRMVEAIEKYRQRQMLNVHDKYTRQMNLVRDNYHQQLETLRLSYASQAGRFRDYRAAQMETVTQHLDTIRDNYAQQIGRIRDYGARRTDQLWDGYERQVNRIRTFTLQKRLRLMQQYKIKQRYVNKLLESLNLESQNVTMMTRQDSEAAAASILAALEEASIGGVELEEGEEATCSKTSSYYSIPDCVEEEIWNADHLEC